MFSTILAKKSPGDYIYIQATQETEDRPTSKDQSWIILRLVDLSPGLFNFVSFIFSF